MSLRIPTEIPPEDKITLSPLDKYRIYGKFPFHMVIHIMLLIFNTLQAIIILSEYTDYFRGQENSFLNILISKDSKEKRKYARKVYLFDISSIQEHMFSSMQKMFDANNTFLNSINFVDNDDEDIEIKNIVMEVDYKINITSYKNENSQIPVSSKYLVSPNYLGPFDKNYSNDDIKDYLTIINKFELLYYFKIYLSKYYKEHKDCFLWRIRQIYDFTKASHFEVRLAIHNEQCVEQTSLSKFEIIMITHLWIHIVVIILATLSVLFCLYNYHEAIRLKKYWDLISKYYKNKNEKDAKYFKLKETISTILKSFNKWDLLIILSNIFQIIGSIVGFMQIKIIMESMDKYIGFGVFLCYLSIGKYIDYSQNYGFFYQTFINTLPDFIPSLISIIPIIIGFIFLGLCLFWDSERFTRISDIMKALVSVTLGDSIYDIITDITGKSNFFGQIYGYIFTILFIIVVMNVFVAVIQEGFVKTKFKNRSHWIYNSLHKNEDIQNECIKNLPNIDKMDQTEIKQELENRIILMNKGLNKCINLIEDVDKNKDDIDEEKKNELKKILREKIEEIDNKMEVIRVVWEND